jgi:hypothetical protein
LTGVCSWLGRPYRPINCDGLWVTLSWLPHTLCLPNVFVRAFLLIMASFTAVTTSLPQILTASPSMTLSSLYKSSPWWNRAVSWMPLFALHTVKVMHIPLTSIFLCSSCGNIKFSFIITWHKVFYTFQLWSTTKYVQGSYSFP